MGVLRCGHVARALFASTGVLWQHLWAVLPENCTPKNADIICCKAWVVLSHQSRVPCAPVPDVRAQEAKWPLLKGAS
jgi:hypothetical protein